MGGTFRFQSSAQRVCHDLLMNDKNLLSGEILFRQIFFCQRKIRPVRNTELFLHPDSCGKAGRGDDQVLTYTCCPADIFQRSAHSVADRGLAGLLQPIP